MQKLIREMNKLTAVTNAATRALLESRKHELAVIIAVERREIRNLEQNLRGRRRNLKQYQHSLERLNKGDVNAL